jgi:hypothetical protein
MKFKNLFLIIILFVVIKSNAQNFELGKVSIGNLEQMHPKDSSAAAIFFERKTSFEYTQSDGFSMVLKLKRD